MQLLRVLCRLLQPISLRINTITSDFRSKLGEKLSLGVTLALSGLPLSLKSDAGILYLILQHPLLDGIQIGINFTDLHL